jgi:hypothetical protein
MERARRTSHDPWMHADAATAVDRVFRAFDRSIDRSTDRPRA